MISFTDICVRHRLMMIFLLNFFLAILTIQMPCYAATIDEIILNATTTFLAFDLFGPMDTVTVEMDIIMPLKEYLEFIKADEEPPVGKRRKKRNVVRNKLWNKTVPYEIDSGFSEADKQNIQDAIQEWNNSACVAFREATTNDADKLMFVDGNGCTSYVGKIGGVQKITLAKQCRMKRIVLHEIGHALGFFHEHTADKREQYVTINESNVPAAFLYNFRKVPNIFARMFDDNDYDYLSIMHLGSRVFSKNGDITLVTKNAGFQNVIGYAEGLSFRDVLRANKLYSCSEGCPASPCQGFQAKDCKCYCPSGNPNNPLRLCSDTSTPSTTTQPDSEKSTEEFRRIQDRKCKQWSNATDCDQLYMRSFCTSICKQDTPKRNDDAQCKDKGTYCNKIDYTTRACPALCSRDAKSSADKSSSTTILTSTCMRTAGAAWGLFHFIKYLKSIFYLSLNFSVYF